VRLQVAAPNHPITAGLANFEVVDETYRMGEPDPGSEVLLTTDHPLSLRSIAWARSFGRSRVFCLALGHDVVCWYSLTFEQVLTRGIRWTVNG
jgi:type 1 glutamine amidotransferase